jgi:hypothetical protein
MPLRRLVGGKGPYPYHVGKHLIMAVRMLVRADESGTHDGAKVCAVVGYVASPAQWKLFDSEWRKVLRAYGVEAHGFHGKVFFNRKRITDKKKNPYFGWPDKRANAYMDELMNVIDSRKVIPVGGGVDIPDFESFAWGEQCALVGYWKKRGIRKTSAPLPYHMALRLLLVDAADETEPDGELHFLVARQNELKFRAFEAYSQMKRHITEREARYKSFGVAEPIDQPSLQAADLIAGWYAKGWSAARVQKPQSPYEVRAIKRLGRRRMALPYYHREAMDELLDDMESQLGRGFRAWLLQLKPEEGWPGLAR